MAACRSSYRKAGYHLKNSLHNVLGGTSAIEAIRPSTEGRSTIVDIEIRFGASNEIREDVITRMFMAGYKLRNDVLNTLTFMKETE